MKSEFISEKMRTRDVKDLAVAQWIRSIPEERDPDLSSDNRNATTVTEKEAEYFTNVTINVKQAPDIDNTESDDLMCNSSSINACSTKPLLLHGNKCRINDPDKKCRRLSAAKSLRRVKFDMKASNENADDLADDGEMRVKYDVIIRTAEEDNAELKRSMAKFLEESAARKYTKKQHTHRKSSKSRSSIYVLNSEEADDHKSTGIFEQPSPVEGCSRSRKSSYSVREFDDVMIDKHALRTATHGHSPQRTHCHQSTRSTRSALSPGVKRANRQKPGTVYLKCSTGTQEVQTPVIKGLVVDVVENQKPSVVRASKNANIREEFALRQKVEGYRASCSQSISRINFAQRKLGTNLINLRTKMVSRAQADDKVVENNFCVKTLSEELFMQSKGYFPEVRLESRAYNFPPLAYPKRRVLTIS